MTWACRGSSTAVQDGTAETLRSLLVPENGPDLLMVPVGRPPDKLADARGGRKPRFMLRSARYDRLMWSLVYLLMRTLVAFMIGTRKRGRDEHAKDLEILVLRHQLRVLQRTAGRPQLRIVDRVLLVAASRVLSRGRWVAFLVTPATLLRWP